MKRGIKHRIAGVSLAAILAVASLVPASAATAKFNFTTSGNVYGITTTATGFSGNVSAWAKVSNNGKYVYSKITGYKSAQATAKKTCTSGNVSRTGGVIY